MGTGTKKSYLPLNGGQLRSDKLLSAHGECPLSIIVFSNGDPKVTLHFPLPLSGESTGLRLQPGQQLSVSQASAEKKKIMFIQLFLKQYISLRAPRTSPYRDKKVDGKQGLCNVTRSIPSFYQSNWDSCN